MKRKRNAEKTAKRKIDAEIELLTIHSIGGNGGTFGGMHSGNCSQYHEELRLNPRMRGPPCLRLSTSLFVALGLDAPRLRRLAIR